MSRFLSSLVLSMMFLTTAATQAIARNTTNISTQSAKILALAVTSAGQFVSVEHPTKGQVKIIEKNGVHYLELAQDFKSDRGPDLKVILNRPKTANSKVQEGEYLNLGPLKSLSGPQLYLIPHGVNLNDYQSVVIWCERFNVTFGYAPLKINQ